MLHKCDVSLCAEIIRTMILEERCPEGTHEAGQRHELRKGQIFGGRAIHAARALSYLMRQLKLLAPELSDASGNDPVFLQCELDEINGHLLVVGSDANVNLNDVLKVFVEHLVLQQGLYSEERVPFLPPKKYQSLTDLLCRQEYLRVIEGKCVWTDKIGQAMYEAGLWNNGFESLRTIQKQQTVLAAQLAWKTMPDEVRNVLPADATSWDDDTHFFVCLSLDELYEKGEWPWVLEEWGWLETGEVANEIMAISNKHSFK